MRHKLMGLAIIALGIGLADMAYAQCVTDDDCDPGDFCDITTGVCYGWGTVVIGGDCWSDYDCLPGDLCDDTGYCVAGPECLSDADCGEDICDEATATCIPNWVDGTIVDGAECGSDADCESDFCDTSTGLCAAASSGCAVASTKARASTGPGLLALGLAAALGVTLVIRRRRRK